MAGWEAFEADAQQEVRRPVTPELLATEPEATREQNDEAAPIFAERLPGAEIHSIENAGHDLIADVPQKRRGSSATGRHGSSPT